MAATIQSMIHRALLNTAIPWWCMIILTWLLIGISEGDRWAIEFFIRGLLMSGIGGWIVVITGIICIIASVYVINDLFTKQIEDQVAYILSENQLTYFTTQEAYQLAIKPITWKTALTLEEKQTLNKYISGFVRPATKAAIESVYNDMVLGFCLFLSVMGLVFVIAPRFVLGTSIMGYTFVNVFALLLSLGLLWMLNELKKKFYKVTDLKTIVNAYETFIIYEQRFMQTS